MGGKRLKFPMRQKFVDKSKIIDAHANTEEKTISDDEHKKRLEMLKKLGLLKE